MKKQVGFSLIEMLAALSVLAIAGVALMSALTTNVRTVDLMQDRVLAMMAAQNIMAEILIDHAGKARRTRSGRYKIAGRDYDWRVEYYRMSDLKLYEANLTLRDQDTNQEYARLVSFVRSAQ